MSHYSNVQTIIKAIEQTDTNRLQDYVEETYRDDDKFRSLVYVLVRMWGGMTLEARQELKIRTTNETVNEELDLIFWEEDDDEQ